MCVCAGDLYTFTYNCTIPWPQHTHTHTHTQLAAATAGVNKLDDLLTIVEGDQSFTYAWCGMLDKLTKKLGVNTWLPRYFVLLDAIDHDGGAELRYYGHPVLPGNERFFTPLGTIAITRGTAVKSNESAGGTKVNEIKCLDIAVDGRVFTLRATTNAESLSWATGVWIHHTLLSLSSLFYLAPAVPLSFSISEKE